MQTQGSFNRKFSISLLKLNQMNLNQKDQLYEFDAPKYFDLSTLPESPIGKYILIIDFNIASTLKIDSWFLVNHSDTVKIGKVKGNPKKKKHSQYLKENTEYIKEEAGSRNNSKIEKRSKPPLNASSNLITTVKGSKSIDKLSIIKTSDHSNLSKERRSNFKRSDTVSKTFNNIKKLKRGVSTDTYTYYSAKLKSESKDNNDQSKKAISKIKITYCPRIHDAKMMKKWEDIKGLKWYELSPRSRSIANDEITLMIKQSINEEDSQL